MIHQFSMNGIQGGILCKNPIYAGTTLCPCAGILTPTAHRKKSVLCEGCGAFGKSWRATEDWGRLFRAVGGSLGSRGKIRRGVWNMGRVEDLSRAVDE